MSNHENNIEDLFRKAFEGRELPVTNSHWDAIAAGLAKRKRKIAYWWFAAILLFFAGSTAALFYAGVFSEKLSKSTPENTVTIQTGEKENLQKKSNSSGNPATNQNNTNELKNSTTDNRSSQKGNIRQHKKQILESNNGKKQPTKTTVELPTQIIVSNPLPSKALEIETLNLVSKNYSLLPTAEILFEPYETTSVNCTVCKKPLIPTWPGLELQFGLGAANNGASFTSSNESQLNNLRGTDKNLLSINPYINLTISYKKFGFSAGLKHLTFGEKTNYDYVTRNVKAIPHYDPNGKLIGYFYLPGLSDTTIKQIRTKNIYQSIQLPLAINIPVRFGHRGYLQISGGTTLGYVYNIKAETPYRFHNVPGSNFLQDPTSIVNRLQFMGSLGAEYRMPISKNWMFSTSIQGNMQLNNFYEKTSGMTLLNRNSQLNFGLVYKIK